MFSQSPTRTRSFQSITRRGVQWCVLLVGGLCILNHAYPQGRIAETTDQQKLIEFLNKTINWYQHGAIQQQVAMAPTDLFFASENRPVADQIVDLSFDFARAKIFLINSNSGTGSRAPISADPRYAALMQTNTKLGEQEKQLRTELGTLQEKLNSASRTHRKGVASAIAETQSKLALLALRQDAVRNILQFIQAAEPQSLASQIDTLRHSIPTASAENHQSELNQSVVPASSNRAPEPLGIWGTLHELFGLSRKISVLKDNIRRTDDLIEQVKDEQVPLHNQLDRLVSQDEASVGQLDSQDPAVLETQKSSLDAAAVQFKAVESAQLPLGKEAVLLQMYKKNLTNWHAAAKNDYSANIKSLLLRLLALGIFLGFVLGVFELWRRAIFHYILDLRRRYQYLLLRRIALWLVLSLIVILGLVRGFGSLATFAGLLTAGVAVALQNVILAIVGYFLLIGKFGVQVGDRVEVSGVTGEVTEIGMIRLHVMELSGVEADAQPTGRVVAFANTVVFQPTAGLFRQVPGASLIWRDVSFTLSPDSDLRTAEQRVLAAVDAAFKDYQANLEQLRHRMEVSLGTVSVGSLAPKVRFRLTPTGLEVHLRFPTDLQKAAETDDRITRELVRAIELEPKLKVVQAEGPAIRYKTASSATGNPPGCD